MNWREPMLIILYWMDRSGPFSNGNSCDPHPALRATLSQGERVIFNYVPLPLGEGGAKRRVRVARLGKLRATTDEKRTLDNVGALYVDLPLTHGLRASTGPPVLCAPEKIRPQYALPPLRPTRPLPGQLSAAHPRKWSGWYSNAISCLPLQVPSTIWIRRASRTEQLPLRSGEPVSCSYQRESCLRFFYEARLSFSS